MRVLVLLSVGCCECSSARPCALIQAQRGFLESTFIPTARVYVYKIKMKAHVQPPHRDQKVRSNRGEEHAPVCSRVCERACTRCLFTYPEHVSTSEITPTAVTQPDELSSNMRLSQLAFVKPPRISKKQMEDRKKRRL